MDKYKAQNKYQKEKMKHVKASYKTEFVEEFKESCKKLNVTQSQVIREAMENIIKKAQKKD